METYQQRVAVALLIGCAAAAIPSILQPHGKAGSFPDLVCEVVLLPGKLIATLFHDRGTASAEFLWRSRVAQTVLFGGLAYAALRCPKIQGKD
jgi:hypothetical protein